MLVGISQVSHQIAYLRTIIDRHIYVVNHIDLKERTPIDLVNKSARAVTLRISHADLPDLTVKHLQSVTVKLQP